MVKASLRKSPATAVVVETQIVETPVEDVKIECQNSVAPAGDLVNILPSEASESSPEPTQAVARRSATSAVSVPRDNNFHVDGFEGDWGTEDLKFPQLKMVQGSGPLSAQFDIGTVIYGETELFPPFSVKADAKNPVLRFVPISITKQFREKLTDEQVKEGEMPRIFNSIQEVEDAGLTTRWIGNTRPDNYAEPSGRVLLLLEAPENTEHPGFALDLDGKNYAVAVYYAAGGAFRAFPKVIYNTAMTSLLVPVLGEDKQPIKTPKGQIVKRSMLYKNFWTLAFERKSNEKNSWWTPKVSLIAKEETSQAIRDYCASVIGGSAVETAAEAES